MIRTNARSRVTRTFTFLSTVAAMAVGVHPLSGAQSSTASIVGAWTLNKDLSDPAGNTPQRGDGSDRGSRGGYGGRRGGFGGGGRGGFGRDGGDRGRGNPDEMRRMRDAMRDILEAPDRMTITQTESMVIITTGDGRTTRLSTDGSKVKDESTGIERRTHWDQGQLVTEISGAGPGRITETYAVNPDTHRLVVTLQFGNDSQRPANHRVYDKQN